VALTGRIIEQQRNYYVIDTPEGPLKATMRGAMRTARPCVGDIVTVEIINRDSSEAQIHAIHERRTAIARPPLANMDQCIVVATLIEPAINLEQLDRLIFFGQAGGCSVLVVFNKIDMLDTGRQQELLRLVGLYESAGYRVAAVSAAAGTNLDNLVAQCSGSYSFLVGESGVGKTTLLAALFPQRSFRTSALSRQTRRGIHTTTSIELLKLAGGGYIADTPGFSQIALPFVAPLSVISYFSDLMPSAGACRFTNCAHENEPGCAVKARVESGEAALSRYEHYIGIYREMKKRSMPGANMRLK
jgi:ribosome biogenesis GTPase